MAEELGVEGLHKGGSQGSNLQHETKYSLDYNYLGSVQEPNEDDWFEEVNHQKNETNAVSEEFPIISLETKMLDNSKLLNTLCSICNNNLINSKDLKEHNKIHKTE